MKQTVAVPDQLAAIKLSTFATKTLNEIRESSTKYDGVTTTATALAPARPEQDENPIREEEEPDRTGGYQVVIPELAGVTRGVAREVCLRRGTCTVCKITRASNIIFYPETKLIKVEDEEGNRYQQKNLTGREARAAEAGLTL